LSRFWAIFQKVGDFIVKIAAHFAWVVENTIDFLSSKLHNLNFTPTSIILISPFHLS